MKKITLSLTLLTLVSLLSAGTAPAAEKAAEEQTPVEGTVVVSDFLNLRTGAAPRYPVAGKVAGNTKVQIFGMENSWLIVKAPETLNVYVSEVYIRNGKAVRELNMRNRPDSKAVLVGVLAKGTPVKVVKSCGRGWVQIQPPEDLRLYASRYYVDFDAEAVKAVEVKKAEVKAEAKPVEEVKAEVKAEAKPAEEVKAEEKAEAKPVEEKKAEVKAEAKPAEVKKAEVKAEAKPVEVKKAEVKAEAKPVEEVKAEVKAEAKPAEVKKAEVKAEDKKVETKAVEKKAEVKKATKKIEVSAEADKNMMNEITKLGLDKSAKAEKFDRAGILIKVASSNNPATDYALVADEENRGFLAFPVKDMVNKDMVGKAVNVQGVIYTISGWKAGVVLVRSIELR